MTSKENFERIKSFLGSNYCYELRDEIELVEKDLEILEILKEQLHIKVYIGCLNNTPLYFLKIMGYDFFIPRETYDKLKEWLNNE